MKAKAVETRDKTGAVNNIMVLKSVIVGVISIILGASQLFGTIAPFAPAFLGALPSRYLLTALVGSVVGSMLFASPIYQMYYIISLCIIFGIRLILSKIIKGRAKPLLYGCITMTVMTILSLTYSSISMLVQLNVVLMLLEAFLAGALTYFYAISADKLLVKKWNISMSTMEMTSITILIIPLIAALAGISIFRVSLGVIVGVVCIYIAIARYGIVGASVSSIIVAIALNMYSLEMMEFSGMLIISAFIAGVFSPIKKFGIMTALVAVSTFSLFLLGAPIALAFRVIEILFATAIFVLIPPKFLQTGASIETTKSGITPIKSSISSKLDFASDTIRDLQQDLVSVSKRFDEIDSNNISTVYDSAAGIVCRGCTMQLKCWDDNCNETIRAFYPLNNALRQYSKVDKTQMPSYFQDNCCKLEKLTNEINNCYHAYSIKEGTKRHVTESRGLIIDQFHSIADMLLEVGDELSDISGYDEEATNAATKAFIKLCCEPTQVISTIDKFGRTSIEIYVEKNIAVSKLAICEAISNVTQKDFDLPCISNVNGKTKIALFEKATFCIDFSAEQKSCNSDDVCGDCYEYFIDKGYAYCVLSDGMGSGKRAAIDSVMTCSILVKLVKAGFGLQSALKLINSSLLVKSTDESLATLDVARIDLYTGETELYKAGAASSYVCTKGRCIKVDTTSLPMGIIREVELEQTHVQLRSRDLLVMVSDGVSVADNPDDEWLSTMIGECSHMNAKDISSRIMFEAQKKQTDMREDDRTIIVCKIKKGI